MKRIFILLVLALVCAGAGLTGCGNSDNQTSTPNAPTTSTNMAATNAPATK